MKIISALQGERGVYTCKALWDMYELQTVGNHKGTAVKLSVVNALFRASQVQYYVLFHVLRFHNCSKVTHEEQISLC